MDKRIPSKRANLQKLFIGLSVIVIGLLLAPGCGSRVVPPHGVEFTAVMETNSLAAGAKPADLLARAADGLRKRMDRLGLAGVSVQPTNGDGLLIRLPGLTDADKTNAVRLIQRGGWLEFRLVHPENDELIKEGLTPPAYELLQRKERLRDGTQRVEQVLVRKQASLSGSCIKNAVVMRDNLGNPQVAFTLTTDSASTFGQLTRDNVGHRLAIMVDSELFSAPMIVSPIETGRGQITGNFEMAEAVELANVLANPLPVRLKVVSEASF